jgi:hypothetical protein
MNKDNELFSDLRHHIEHIPAPEADADFARQVLSTIRRQRIPRHHPTPGERLAAWLVSPLCTWILVICAIAALSPMLRRAGHALVESVCTLTVPSPLSLAVYLLFLGLLAFGTVKTVHSE